MEKGDGRSRPKGHDNRPRHALRILQARNHDGERRYRESGRRPGDGVPSLRESFHAVEEIPGHVVHAQPKKSRICVLAMRMAIPFVKPTMTGRGKYLTAVPMPVTPSKTRRTPAIMVHVKSPSMPYLATIPETTTTNAPVGPPICVFEPPSAEIKNPVTMAQ